MVHIYYGDGKGKTTSAFGLAVRAAGSNYSVIVAQFLKPGNISGELNIFSEICNITVVSVDIPNVFSWQMTDIQKANTIEQHNILFEKAVSLCKNDKTLLVLDEIINAMTEKLINTSMVLNFLEMNGRNIEIILTGRYPTVEVLQLGDYVTEMKKIKHPYDSGIKMRKGIEY